MAKESYNGPLERVDACCWRIPKSYKQGMLVDGLIFANDVLIEQIRKDQAPDQVANVAFLPGIQQASLAMPDIHWGYGFCIGGVCATDPTEGGVITPGGIGFDINCLVETTCVSHAHGYTRRIGDMSREWASSRLACYDLSAGRRADTDIDLWFAQKPRAQVLRVVTESGDEVRATADHPFWTPTGMVPSGKLTPGDRVAVNPFRGVPYEEPDDEVILTEEDVRAKLDAMGRGIPGRGSRTAQVLGYLKRRDLLPLRRSSPALPVLCKVLGFVAGDGSLYFETVRGKGVTTFHGDAPDLETIREDLRSIGVNVSRVYSRQRNHRITTTYREYQFERREDWAKVSSTGFAVLLACLGCPVGKKPHQTYTPPAWLDRAPLWHKRLYLAGLFGAELTAPSTLTGHDTVFYCPTLSMNKRPAHAEGGRLFLEQLSVWLAQFGVTTQKISRRDEQVNADGERSVRWRLELSSRPESLINLWSKVGFEYNRKRSGLASLAAQYLRVKDAWLQRRQGVARKAAGMAATGVAREAAVRELVGVGVSDSFVGSSWGRSAERVCRVTADFPTFAQYQAEASVGDTPDGMVWERVAEVEPVDYDGLVYDFTVAHPDHNFVADGFVVSNCGVRLVRTNLFYRDVKHHLQELINELFNTVPAGVGRSGQYKFTPKEMKPLLTEGPRYVIESRSLGHPRDLAVTEANGRIDHADPGEVSERAIARGAESCGTLGSGNHFMEVQVVDAVFDGDTAGVFGLEKDQVCVMIHSGSRGLGYQVCDDALAMLRKVPEKYGIVLPDKQLACAPAESPEGKKYIAAMRAAANFGFCNRQLLMEQARTVFAKVFGRSWQDLDMWMLYDVAHNIAKLEEHTVNGKRKRVWVHRKGATRAFPPGHPELPDQYKAVGQPVIIPGDMGRASWVLAGAQGSMEKTFGTTCHGAGRAMSRTAAVREAGNRKIAKELEARGIIARAQSARGLAEEQPKAYKNVDDVVDTVHDAGLSRKVARMRPIGVIKG